MPVYPLNREKTWLFPPTLDELIPQDHPVRFVAALVDGLERSVWEEMEIRLEGSPLGAPSYNPRGMLSVWVYGFMTGTRSTRKLEAACRDQMPYLWLTGWEHPDHNSLWRFYNAHRMFMRKLFKRTVGTAVKLGLVDLAIQAVDGSKVAANASKKRSYDAAQLQELLAKTEAAIKDLEAQNEAAADPAPVHLPKELVHKEWLLAQVKAAMVALARTGQKWINLTDGDAPLLKASHQTRIVGYNMEAMVSVARAPKADTVTPTVCESTPAEAQVSPAATPEVAPVVTPVGQATPTEVEVLPAPEAKTVTTTVGERVSTEAEVLPAPPLEVAAVAPTVCESTPAEAEVSPAPAPEAEPVITAVGQATPTEAEVLPSPEANTVVTPAGESVSTEAEVPPAPPLEVAAVAPTSCQPTPIEAEVLPGPEVGTGGPTTGQPTFRAAGVALPPQTKPEVTGLFITAIDVVAEQNDLDALIPMLEQSEENAEKRADFCLADANFHSGPNLGACAQRQQAVVISEPHEKDLDQPYHKDRFVYDANSDSYTCPQGQILRFRRMGRYRETPVRVYSAGGAICSRCPAFGTCTIDRSNGRRLQIGPYDSHLRRHREWMATGQAKDLYKKRKELPEPVFGIMKEQQGARRFLLRGLPNVRAEATLLATAFNIRTLCNMWRKGVAAVVQWVRAGAGEVCGGIKSPAGRRPEKQDIARGNQPESPSKGLCRIPTTPNLRSCPAVAYA